MRLLRVTILLLSVLCASLIAPRSALATHTDCVTNETMFKAALLAAQTRQDDTVILMNSGTYVGGFSYTPTTSFSLTIRGGYAQFVSTPCGIEIGTTTLDGNNQLPVLRIESGAQGSGDLNFEKLTFSNGQLAPNDFQTAGLGANLPAVYTGNISIYRCVFKGNAGNDGNGALNIVLRGNGQIHLLNNVFFGNSGGRWSAAYLLSQGAVVVNNNTVADSATPMASNASAAFEIDPSGSTAVVSNNIFVHSFGGPDLYATNALLSNNDVGVVQNAASTSFSGDFSAEPKFVDELSGDLRLSATSPLIDSGNDTPLGGVLDFDADGNPRIAGAHVDIGAYEVQSNDRIFYSNLDVVYY